MTTYTKKHSFCVPIACLIAAISLPINSPAQTVTWKGSASNDWNTPEAWSTDEAPVAGNDYAVSGAGTVITTPSDGGATFGGDSLSITDNATLYLFRDAGGSTTSNTYTVNNLSLSNATLKFGHNFATGTISLANQVELSGNVVIDVGGASNFTLTSNLNNGYSGTGTLELKRSTDTGTGRALYIKGTNSTANYSGNVITAGYSSGKTLDVHFETASGWGTGSLTVGDYSSVNIKQAIAGTGDVTISAAGTLNFESSANFAFDKSISGSGTLTKKGTGTLTLTGDNSSFSGNTMLNGGTLNVGSANALGTAGTISFTGGTLQYSNNNQVDYSSRFNTGSGQAYRVDTNGQTVTWNTGLTSADGSLTKSGSGVLILGGDNAYSGNTVISGGTLSYASTASSTGGGAITRSGGGTLHVSEGANIITSTANTAEGIMGGWATYGNTWAVANEGSAITGLTSFASDLTSASANVDVTGSLVATGSTANTLRFGTAGSSTLTLTGTTVLTSGGILITSDVGANDITITGGTSLAGSASGELVVHQNNSNGLLTIDTVIADNSGATNLVKTGEGTLILGGANTYTGNTIVNQGTLRLSNGGSIASTGELVIAANAAFDSNDSNITTSSLKGAGLLDMGSGSATVSAGSFDGVISGTGGLTKNGTGELVLKGTNTYTGITTISAGKLTLGIDDAVSSSSGIVISGNNSAITLDIGNTHQTLTSLQFEKAASTPATKTVIGVGGTLTVNAGSETLEFVNSNSSASGNAQFNFTGLSNFEYTTTGNIEIWGNGNARNATLTLGENTIFTANSFEANNGHAGGQTAKSATINLGDNTIINADTIYILNDNNKDSAYLKFRTDLSAAPSLKIRASDGTGRAAWNVGTTITGTGTASVDLTTGVAGSSLDALVSTLQIGSKTSGNNVFNANFYMGEGILDATSINVGTTSAGTLNSTLSVTGGTVKVDVLTLGTRTGGTLNSTLNLNGGATLAAQTIQAGTGTATRVFNWNDGTIKNYNASNGLTIGSELTLTMATNGLHAIDIGAGQTGTVNAVIAGSGTLTKIGTGQVTLNTANTYTGSTIIKEGIFALGASGSIVGDKIIVEENGTFDVSAMAGAGGYAIGSGQTLSGTGLVKGNITIGSGATLAPGSSPGTLSFTGDVTLADGAALVIEIDTDSGLHDVIDLGNNKLIIDNNTQLHVVVTGNGTLESSYNIIANASAIEGFDKITVTNGFALGSDGSLTAVPEPSTYGLIGAGLLIGMASLARRRRSKQ